MLRTLARVESAPMLPETMERISWASCSAGILAFAMALANLPTRSMFWATSIPTAWELPRVARKPSTRPVRLAAVLGSRSTMACMAAAASPLAASVLRPLNWRRTWAMAVSESPMVWLNSRPRLTRSPKPAAPAMPAIWPPRPEKALPNPPWDWRSARSFLASPLALASCC